VKQRPHELRAPLPSQLPHIDGGRAARQVAGQPRLVNGAHAASLTRGLRKPKASAVKLARCDRAIIQHGRFGVGRSCPVAAFRISRPMPVVEQRLDDDQAADEIPDLDAHDGDRGKKRVPAHAGR
jgi:hypothetical protein